MRQNFKKGEKMKRNAKKLYATFAPETHFEVEAEFRALQQTEFERLKNRLLQQLLNDIAEAELNLLFRQAAGDAAALAWTTPFPLLLLPELLWEKARRAQLQKKKQNEIRGRSEKLVETI
ncbi:MAG: hypothetical protein ACR2H1_06080 [Limisphaerales bacterium]